MYAFSFEVGGIFANAVIHIERVTGKGIWAAGKRIKDCVVTVKFTVNGRYKGFWRHGASAVRTMVRIFAFERVGVADHPFFWFHFIRKVDQVITPAFKAYKKHFRTSVKSALILTFSAGVCND